MTISNRLSTFVCVAAAGVLAFLCATAQAGEVTGPNNYRDFVHAGATDFYMFVFEAGTPANVYVEGDHDTDLDLYVRDENGNEVCAENDATDVMICRWTPSSTGEFSIRIENLGDVYNAYTLRTN